MLTVAGLTLAASILVGQNSVVNVPSEVQSEFEYLVGDWTISGQSQNGAVTSENHDSAVLERRLEPLSEVHDQGSWSLASRRMSGSHQRGQAGQRHCCCRTDKSE